MTDPERSDIQERLLHLYLRLNGYFVSGFIPHSHEHGKILTQVDALAVRHPFNCEPKRGIEPTFTGRGTRHHIGQLLYRWRIGKRASGPIT
jgi:hypothetical protein